MRPAPPRLRDAGLAADLGPAHLRTPGDAENARRTRGFGEADTRAGAEPARLGEADFVLELIGAEPARRRLGEEPSAAGAEPIY